VAEEQGLHIFLEFSDYSGHADCSDADRRRDLDDKGLNGNFTATFGAD